MTYAWGRSNPSPVVDEQTPTAGDIDAIVAGFEHLPAAIFVLDGPDHWLAAVNRAGRVMAGPHREMLDRRFTDVVPDVEGQRIGEILDEAYDTGQTVSREEWRIFLDPDGDGELNEFFVSFTVVPTRNPDGALRGVVARFVDVTSEVVERREELTRATQRYHEARDLVLALQRSLLPTALPVLPRTRLAAHYLVASGEQAAGGDWFDAVAVPDGRLALTVGDVVGHGARASAVMGQIRAVLSEFVLDSQDVAQVLARLDRFVERVPGAGATTVCLAILDPVSGLLTYACAGHPPPLVVTSAGKATFLPAPSGAPLGTAGRPPATRTVQLTAGDLLLLYTDGLVERSGRTLDDGMARLSRAAADSLTHATPELMATAAVDRVCGLTLERMTADGFRDDVTLLAAQWTEPADLELELDLAAEAAALGPLRSELVRWLDELGAGAEDIEHLQLAVLEAATNVVEHAYIGDGGRMTVSGMLDRGGRVCLSVDDEGSWRPPPAEPGLRGRGFMLIRNCMDTVEIEQSAAGTSVMMDRVLRRAPVLVSSGGPGPVGPVEHADEMVVEIVAPAADGHPRITVAGPVDISTVGELQRALHRAGRGGILPMTVDITGVSHLASSGVQLLHQLGEQMAADARELRLISPLGTPARQVLELTGLEHLAHDAPAAG
jgi:anti-anti-sigma factor